MRIITEHQTAIKSVGYVVREEERQLLESLSLPFRGKMKAFLLEGAPGTGKTYLGECLAKGMEWDLVYYQVHCWTDADELFVGVNVSAAVAGDSQNVVQPGVLALAAERSQKGKVVLILDEVDKASERVEFLLLDFLQTGRVPVGPGKHVLADPANIVVFLTSNKERELGDALIRRVRRTTMRPLSKEVQVAKTMEELRLSHEKKGLVSMAFNAITDIATADGKSSSVQELINLTEELIYLAKTKDDVTRALISWAVKGQVGRSRIETWRCKLFSMLEV